MSDIICDFEPISLNDLPRFSDWPKRLLSLERFEIKHKTEAEVQREYQDEKWGELLLRVRSLSKPTPIEIEKAFNEQTFVDFSTNRLPCYYEGKLCLASGQQMQDKHLDLYADVLRPYLAGASCLVELGAGYGSKIFNLAQRNGFSNMPLIAGEYTQNGRDLISLLSEASRKPIDVGHCDFRAMNIQNVTIPENALIFTSYAVHYVPELSDDFVSFLAKLKPKAVVHFEPCYEYYTTDTLNGMMCRRYMELNDYTRNLVTVIEACRRRGEISVRVQKNVLGTNPFLPISVIEWAPLKDSDTSL